MTPKPITVRNLTDVALVAPFMLGYWPERSVCVLLVDADGHVQLIMRWHVDAPEVPPHLPLAGDAEVAVFHLLVFCDHADPAASAWRGIADDIGGRGVPLGRVAFVATDGEVVTVRAEDPFLPASEPAPESARTVVGPHEISAIGERWDMPMWTPSREEYVSDIAPDAGRQEEVGSRIRVLPDVTEAARDRVIGDTIDALSTGEVSADAMASILVALGDVRVRDTVLWELMHSPVPTWADAADTLAEVVSCAPRDHVAPAATILAILRWQQGDGSRAGAAVERALEADSDYSLADLINRCLLAGLHPSTWAEGLVGLSREACRRAA